MHPNEIRLVHPAKTVTPAQLAELTALLTEATQRGPAYEEALALQAERQQAEQA